MPSEGFLFSFFNIMTLWTGWNMSVKPQVVQVTVVSEIWAKNTVQLRLSQACKTTEEIRVYITSHHPLTTWAFQEKTQQQKKSGCFVPGVPCSFVVIVSLRSDELREPASVVGRPLVFPMCSGREGTKSEPWRRPSNPGDPPLTQLSVSLQAHWLSSMENGWGRQRK